MKRIADRLSHRLFDRFPWQSTLALERECWRSPHLFSVKGDDVQREERRQGNERRRDMEESRQEEGEIKEVK
ncbi:hypothetical protein Q8A73_009760 [Channa argus]|nr:hypothetical protein Q8A73_009760 [Channa argus]